MSRKEMALYENENEIAVFAYGRRWRWGQGEVKDYLIMTTNVLKSWAEFPKFQGFFGSSCRLCHRLWAGRLE